MIAEVVVSQLSEKAQMALAFAALSVWSDIAADCLAVAGKRSLIREEVLDLVLDGGRVEHELMFGGGQGEACREAARWMKEATAAERREVLAELAFEDEWYSN